MRRQSEAATALWFNRDEVLIQSGVALRLPPHSKKIGTSVPQRSSPQHDQAGYPDFSPLRFESLVTLIFCGAL